jgi:hypothetical protein
MKLPTIKKPDSAKSGSLNKTTDQSLRLERLKNNSIQLFNAGYIPKDWVLSIAVIVTGVSA